MLLMGIFGDSQTLISIGHLPMRQKSLQILSLNLFVNRLVVITGQFVNTWRQALNAIGL